MNEQNQTPWSAAADSLESIKWLPSHPEIQRIVREACERHASDLRAKLDEARAAAATMPGAWVCDKCGFILQNSKLHVADGSLTANTADECNGCPNDGGPMRALT